jgi:hypothetical protein
MQSYADSMHSLVRARGGLQNLGFQGKIEQLVRWIDAHHGLVAHVACTYRDASDAPTSLLAHVPPKKCGSFWEDERATKVSSPDVHESCTRCLFLKLFTELLLLS